VARRPAAKLAPVAPPPTPTAVDKLPLAKLSVPKGFKIEVWASGVPNARAMRRIRQLLARAAALS
jgi:hypothetical protein